VLSRTTIPVPTSTNLNGKKGVFQRKGDSRHKNATYFVVKRAVHTILLCTKNIRLESREK
jgi:hypothetical protein